MGEKILDTDAHWRATLTPEQYHVTREHGTERAFTGRYWNCETPGMYTCVCCGQPLFRSDAKFDSGTGWPSFTAPVDSPCVQERQDQRLGVVRTDVLCSRCDAPLGRPTRHPAPALRANRCPVGHVRPDGPAPTGLRYCINSAALELAADD